MDVLLRLRRACPLSQSSSRHHMQTPPHVPCRTRSSPQLQLSSRSELPGTLCMAAAGNVQAMPAPRSGMQGQVDTTYLTAANYLKTIGFTNTAEIARVLDIAMNPNSMFVQYNDAKRSRNVNVSCLACRRRAILLSRCQQPQSVSSLMWLLQQLHMAASKCTVCFGSCSTYDSVGNGLPQPFLFNLLCSLSQQMLSVFVWQACQHKDVLVFVALMHFS
eukprot:GHRQ01024606.1.p1 GENE.GHRQ01024606.1~~GHRQ01024606.1.p1  ORF type:complete len:218 (+),score=17.08 GHRQ01024606.1:495-1148(+)